MPELNCRTGQRAWIKVPDTPTTRAIGLLDLNGRVVQTVSLLPVEDDFGPSWVVDPPQVTTSQQILRDRDGKQIPAGTRFHARGIPDTYLRPFTDFPPEDLQVTELELEA